MVDIVNATFDVLPWKCGPLIGSIYGNRWLSICTSEHLYNTVNIDFVVRSMTMGILKIRTQIVSAEGPNECFSFVYVWP